MPKMLKYYKDKEKARLTRNRHRKKNYDKTANIYKGKRRWTDHEDTLILEHTITDFELSAIIIRSVSAIQTRRSKLRKVNNDR